jgi:hypothetical protein
VFKIYRKDDKSASGPNVVARMASRLTTSEEYLSATIIRCSKLTGNHVFCEQAGQITKVPHVVSRTPEHNQKRSAYVMALWIAPGSLCGPVQESTLRVMPSFFILKYKVERFNPKRAAAPLGPERTHLVSFSVFRM